MYSVLLSWVFVLLFGISITSASRILYLTPVASVSHNSVHRQVVSGLLNRGHHVTWLTTFPEEKKNLTCLKLEFDMTELFPEGLDYNIEKPRFQLSEAINGLTVSYHMFKYFLQQSEKLDLVNFLKGKSFDVIIYEYLISEWVLGYSKFLNQIPLISVSPYSNPPLLGDLTGNPNNPSYIPATLSCLSNPMSFVERIQNVIYSYVVNSQYKKLFLDDGGRLAQQFFNDSSLSLYDIWKRTSLVLINSVDYLDEVQPHVPNIIPVGGISVPPVKPLPDNLKKFLDSAKDGFIYFSLGSVLTSSSMDHEKLKQITETFSELPWKVLWKFENDSLPGKPDNVMISPWVPQSDVLAHPNIKLFISHGGLSSTIETVFRGVPVLGVPMLFDQHNNIKRLQHLGVANHLDYSILTKKSLLEAIHTMLGSELFSNRMKELSILVRDQPMQPMDRAIYWIEYVIKHNGAQHLRSAGADLPLYQYLLLDVIGSLAAGFVVASYVLFKLTNMLCKRLLNDKTKSKLKKK